jgi:photosystem II stability/assembly factor-like uncharacterized protein
MLITVIIFYFYAVVLHQGAFAQGWLPVNSNTTANLNGLDFFFTTAVAVGNGGTILLSDDSCRSWRNVASYTTQNLHAVSTADGVNWFAVGSGGTTVRTNNAGIHWTVSTAGTTQTLFAVTAVSASNIWAVGSGGTVVQSVDGGINWSIIPIGVSNTIYAIQFIGLNGWLAGAGGIIYRTVNGGINWTAQFSGTTSDLRSLHFVNSMIGWAVGSNGTVLKTIDGGVSWTAQAAPANNNIVYSVRFQNTLIGTAVGANGLVINTFDGGINWLADNINSRLNATLRTLRFLGTAAAAVGDNGQIFRFTPGVKILTADLPTGVCRGESFPVSFLLYGNYNPGNLVRAWLQSPDEPLDIFALEVGRTITTSSGVVNVQIPTTIVPNQNYRLFLSTSDPVTAITDRVKLPVLGSPPTPVLSGNRVVCQRNLVTYSTDTAARFYYWQVIGGNIIGQIDQPQILVSWQTAGNQAVRLSVNDGCGFSATAQIDVTVQPSPDVPVIEALADGLNPCIGKPISEYRTPTIADAYQWEVTKGTIVSGQASPQLQVKWQGTDTGTIKLRVLKTNGCTDSTLLTIIPTSLTIPVIFQPTQICPPGAPLALAAPPGYTAYRWNTGDTTEVITVNTPGNYVAEIRTADGCITRSDTLKVTVCPRYQAELAPAVAFTTLDLRMVRRALVLDIDNDGLEDVLLDLYNDTLEAPVLWVNRGPDSLGRIRYVQKSELFKFPTYVPKGNFYLADLDGSGSPDLIALRNGELRIYLLEDSGYVARSKELCIENPALTESNNNEIVLTDGNADGFTDWIVSDVLPNGQRTGVYFQGKGSGLLPSNPARLTCDSLIGYCDRTTIAGFSNNTYQKFRAIDFDNDQDEDILVLDYFVGFDGLEFPIRMLRRELAGYVDATERTGLLNLRLSPAGFITVFDYNYDGYPDLLCGSEKGSNVPNRIFKNNGNGTFVEETGIWRLKTADLTYQQALVGDIDNDGDPDIIWVTAEGRLQAYLRQDSVFVEASELLGLTAGGVGGLQAAFVDPDGDGDLDLLLTGGNQTATFLINNSYKPISNYLKTRLIGCKGSRDGRGARVEVILPGGRKLVRYAGYYQSNLPVAGPYLHFGLGTANRIDTIKVFWVGGSITTLANITPNQLITIYEREDCNNLRPEAGFLVRTLEDQTLDFENLTRGADSYFWDFGDGSTTTDRAPRKRYALSGQYRIRLVAYSRCSSDTADTIINYTTLSSHGRFSDQDIKLYPNPSNGAIYVEINSSKLYQPLKLTICDPQARVLYTFNSAAEQVINGTIAIPEFVRFPAGMYYLKLEAGDSHFQWKVYKE